VRRPRAGCTGGTSLGSILKGSASRNGDRVPIGASQVARKVHRREQRAAERDEGTVVTVAR
jgi:hypothetical protein